MKNSINNLKNSFQKGLIFGVGVSISIIALTSAYVFAQNLSVNPGDQLTASMWNNLVNKVDNSVSFLTSESIEGGNSANVTSQNFIIPSGSEGILNISVYSHGIGAGASSVQTFNNRIYVTKDGVETLCSRSGRIYPSSTFAHDHFIDNSCIKILEPGEYSIRSNGLGTNANVNINNLSYSVLLK